MKREFYFYVTADRPHKGVQSNHLAVICVQQHFDDSPSVRTHYKIGVAIKHPKDGLPFKCREGRSIATRNAMLAKLSYASLRDVRDEILRIGNMLKQPLVISPRDLATRIVYVLALHLPHE